MCLTSQLSHLQCGILLEMPYESWCPQDLQWKPAITALGPLATHEQFLPDERVIFWLPFFLAAFVGPSSSQTTLLERPVAWVLDDISRKHKGMLTLPDALIIWYASKGGKQLTELSSGDAYEPHQERAQQHGPKDVVVPHIPWWSPIPRIGLRALRPSQQERGHAQY